MEPSRIPDLVWVFEPIPECFACGEAVKPEEAELSVVGPGADTYLAVLGHCVGCGRWYGLLENVDEILVDQGWDGYDHVEGFRIDGEGQDGVAVCPPSAPGLIPWAAFRQMQGRARASAQAPVPSPAEVRALEETADTWQAGVAPAAWIGPEGAELQLAYLAVVVSGQDDLILATTMTEGAPPDAEGLADLVLRAAAHPVPDDRAPARPQALLVGDADRAAALAERLADAGVAVRAAPTEHAEAVLREAVEHLGSHDEDPYFAAHDEDEIHAYFEAARAFYDAAPWRRIEARKYLAFRLDGGPWQFLNVMGQMEETPGLSVFDDFLHLCRFLHNAPASWGGGPLAEVFGEIEGFSEFIDELTGTGPREQLDAAGSVEGLTLSTLDMLHPADGARLLDLGIEPIDGAYPAPHRYVASGQLDAPRLPLSAYRALLDAVRAAVAKRRANPVTSIKETFTVGPHTVDLRYPSKGEELLPPEPEAVRLSVRVPDDDEVLLRVEAPGETPLKDVARAIQKHGEQWYPTAFGSGEVRFWDNRSQRGDPCPYLVQLPPLEEPLWMEDAWDRYAMDAAFLPAAEGPETVDLETDPA